MAPVDPPRGAKKVGAGLKRKIGPLPLWAWVAIVGGGVAAWYFLLRDRGELEGGAEQPFEIVTGSGNAVPPADAAYGGYPSENAAPVAGLDPTTFDALFQSGLERFGVTAYQGELRGQIKSIEDALESAGWTFEGPGEAFPEGAILPPPAHAAVESYGGVQSSPAATPLPPRPAGPGPKPPKPKPPRKPPKPKPPRKPPKPVKPAPKPPRKPAPKPPRKTPKRPVRRGVGGASVRAM